MSTLSVTTINTGNTTTDLTVKTGNTSGAGIVVLSNGSGIFFQGNSAVTTVAITPNQITVNAAISTVNTSGPSVILYSNGSGIALQGNSADTTATITPNLITVNGAVITSGNLEANGGDVYISRTSTAYGYIVRPNSAGFKNLQFAVMGGGLLDNTVINSTNTYVTGNNLFVGTSTKAANGYSFLPNGLKMNWGSLVVNTISNAVYTSSFTTVYAVYVTAGDNIYVGANTIYVNSTASTTSNAVIRSTSTTTTAKAYYMAIGV